MHQCCDWRWAVPCIEMKSHSQCEKWSVKANKPMYLSLKLQVCLFVFSASHTWATALPSNNKGRTCSMALWPPSPSRVPTVTLVFTFQIPSSKNPYVQCLYLSCKVKTYTLIFACNAIIIVLSISCTHSKCIYLWSPCSSLCVVHAVCVCVVSASPLAFGDLKLNLNLLQNNQDCSLFE